MPSMLDPIDEVVLLLLNGLDRPLEPIGLALKGEAGLPLMGSAEPPLIGVMVAELLGAPIPAPEPALLPRGMKAPVEPPEAGALRGLPSKSPMAAGTWVLWFFVRWPRRPMPLSAFPPANFGPFLSALAHPDNNRPRLHAPIRPKKGILPIALSSPV